jgi:hypothetical protein
LSHRTPRAGKVRQFRSICAHRDRAIGEAPVSLERVLKGGVDYHAWRNAMERLVIAFVFLISFGLALPAVGQTNGAPSTNTEAKSTNTEAKENKVALSEEQKQAIIDAAVLAKSRQKTPKEFSPSVGAIAPKEVYLHGFKPTVTQNTPLLKEYSYAFLDREVVLVGPKREVVALIALPEKLVAGEQSHQGAAEASGANGKGNADSVPSHTSPESIK